jgi:hypothetical protein
VCLLVQAIAEKCYLVVGERREEKREGLEGMDVEIGGALVGPGSCVQSEAVLLHGRVFLIRTEQRQSSTRT